MEILPIKVGLDVKLDLTPATSKLIETLSNYLGLPLKIINRGGRTGSILLSVVDEKIEQKRLDIKRSSEISRKLSTLEAIQNNQNQNINKIIEKALLHSQQYSEAIDTDSVSPEWLNFFFDNAKNISEEQLQELWARILAGEIIQSNSFAIRTFDILKSLNRQEAEYFVNIAKYAFVDASGVAFIIVDHHKQLDKLYSLDFNKKLALEEAGLLHNIESAIPIKGEMGGKVLGRVYLRFGIYEIEIISRGTKSSGFESFIRTLTFTKAGSGLGRFIEHVNDIDLIKQMSYEFRGDGITFMHRKMGDKNWLKFEPSRS